MKSAGSKQQGKVLVKKNQPLKAISQQDINELKDRLEQLASWQEPLKQTLDFFDSSKMPLNKKKIIREFHAQAKVFQTFYADFLVSVDELERQVEKMARAEKVRGG
ncbi:hypothetical protein JZO70_01165 [Enterococcus sp. 669A]|uniref:NF-kappa-B essential modulator NEMO N-terminal domain-containing protein n=1 Tax=Candidatus Enterococcus moelleringii TaxID=2815325 RepID=A0ABS3L560_9ENTE|nr:hypothetical protein [Enterococcus sp. 669A]MBO1304754.1 hypothetical protein [Enterococcus sp. 669A]